MSQFFLPIDSFEPLWVLLALVLFGMVDGSVEAHIDSPTVSDERFITALVDALIRVALWR